MLKLYWMYMLNIRCEHNVYTEQMHWIYILNAYVEHPFGDQKCKMVHWLYKWPLWLYFGQKFNVHIEHNVYIQCMYSM